MIRFLWPPCCTGRRDIAQANKPFVLLLAFVDKDFLSDVLADFEIREGRVENCSEVIWESIRNKMRIFQGVKEYCRLQERIYQDKLGHLGELLFGSEIQNTVSLAKTEAFTNSSLPSI